MASNDLCPPRHFLPMEFRRAQEFIWITQVVAVGSSWGGPEFDRVLRDLLQVGNSKLNRSGLLPGQMYGREQRNTCEGGQETD